MSGRRTPTGAAGHSVPVSPPVRRGRSQKPWEVVTRCHRLVPRVSTPRVPRTLFPSSSHKSRSSVSCRGTRPSPRLRIGGKPRRPEPRARRLPPRPGVSTTRHLVRLLARLAVLRPREAPDVTSRGWRVGLVTRRPRHLRATPADVVWWVRRTQAGTDRGTGCWRPRGAGDRSTVAAVDSAPPPVRPAPPRPLAVSSVKSHRAVKAGWTLSGFQQRPAFPNHIVTAPETCKRAAFPPPSCWSRL